MATVLDIAEYILRTGGGMDTMKLQKLVYYSQAWTLVWADEPLFHERIEAWANGPVVRELFDRHRGRYSISAGGIGGNPEAVTERERKMIDVVVAHYGKWNGTQLSEIAHRERPWIEAREGLGPTERGNTVIDPTVMRDFYTALSREAREARG